MNGMLACASRSATAGSRTKPSSIPRKITLFVVGMRLNTGAELVGGNDTGVGGGCWGSPSPGTRRGTGAVVVVGGTVVVVVVVVVEVGWWWAPRSWWSATVEDGGAVSSPTACDRRRRPWVRVGTAGELEGAFAEQHHERHRHADRDAEAVPLHPVPVGARLHAGAPRHHLVSAGPHGVTVVAAVPCAGASGDPVDRRPAVIGVRGVGGVGAPRHGARQAGVRHDRQRARARPDRPGRVRPGRSPGLRHRHRRRPRRPPAPGGGEHGPRGAGPRRHHRLRRHRPDVDAPDLPPGDRVRHRPRLRHPRHPVAARRQRVGDAPPLAHRPPVGHVAGARSSSVRSSAASSTWSTRGCRSRSRRGWS